MSATLFRIVPLLLFLSAVSLVQGPSLAAADDLQIEISKKGLGKEVVITQGVREWFMLVEVTPENTVIVRQEKDRDQYLVDESETHDRPLAPIEVDAVINDYINSVKARPSAGRMSSRRYSPGCGGSILRTSFLAAMIVLHIHLVGVPLCRPLEGHSPIAA